MKRNGWLNMAAAGTTAVSLLVLGFAVLLVVNTNHIADTVESNVEIMAYLDREQSRDDWKNLRQEIEMTPGVKEVQFISKDEALNSLAGQFGRKTRLKESLGGNNPLPDAFKIRTAKPQQVARVAAAIEKLPGVDQVRYGQGVVEKMFRLTYWVRLITMVFMALLAACAVFLIATTIRLTMFARRREINIMKYVGATDWFVRWPFLLEGMFLGAAGALVAILVLYLTYTAMVDKLQATLPFLPLVRDPRVLLRIVEGMLGAGIGLGVIGSFISVHRYLRV